VPATVRCDCARAWLRRHLQPRWRFCAGTLYPLERGFLYTFKPELIPFDHIEAVEFERQQSGMHASSLRTFDLSITIRADAPTRTKHFQFR
jgi:hypothetical protein